MILSFFYTKNHCWLLCYCTFNVLLYYVIIIICCIIHFAYVLNTKDLLFHVYCVVICFYYFNCLRRGVYGLEFNRFFMNRNETSEVQVSMSMFYCLFYCLYKNQQYFSNMLWLTVYFFCEPRRRQYFKLFVVNLY